MYKFKQIFMMDLINLFTNPMWIFYAIGFPMALILILALLTATSYGNSISSFDYYGVTIMIFAIFNVTSFSANSFMEERIKNANMRIVYSPVKPFYLHFSKVLATFVFCVITYLTMILFLHFFLAVNYGGVNFWASLIVLILAIFFFSAFGVLVCCILKNESDTNQILSLVLTVFAVIGGVFFPIEGFGKAFSIISWISPAKWILSTCLQIIYDQDFSLFLPACLILIVLSILSIFISNKLFKGEDYI